MPYEPIWSDETLTRDNIEALPGATILEFGAEWCPHCQAVQPLLKEQLDQSSIRHLKIADGKGKRLGREFKVKVWPNFVLIIDGEVKEQLARPGQDELKRALETLT